MFSIAVRKNNDFSFRFTFRCIKSQKLLLNIFLSTKYICRLHPPDLKPDNAYITNLVLLLIIYLLNCSFHFDFSSGNDKGTYKLLSEARIYYS